MNGLMNCLVLWSRDHPDLDASLAGLEDWRWQDAEQGVRYAGARSAAWDTAFALRALTASPSAATRVREGLDRGVAFLRDAQLTVELPDPRAQDRDPILGGWCFSDGAHRWPVSDCTAEALTALLEARALLPPGRLAAALEFVLARQNADGGFATYERRRGGAWLERLNPSEMFGRCMTERSYVECTASALGALSRVRAARPDLAGARVETAIERAVQFLRSTQRADGSVPGFWGINFTYGIFHFVEGLRACGVGADDPALVRAAGASITRAVARIATSSIRKASR